MALAPGKNIGNLRWGDSYAQTGKVPKRNLSGKAIYTSTESSGSKQSTVQKAMPTLRERMGHRSERDRLHAEKTRSRNRTILAF
jgi:hypothetical protein